jgi:membrane associated rhomboid family serine protease
LDDRLMFVPLKDDNPLKLIRFQYVSLAIIILNVFVFFMTGPMRGDEALLLTEVGYGVVPSELLDSSRFPSPAFNPISEPLTLITYMFLHAGWLHLLSNMAFMWVFADNVEDAFGSFGFALFYLLCGVAAAMTHALMLPNSHDPLIGASGAVSGVLAAYLLLYPRARVWVLFIMPIPIKIPAWIVLGGWLVLQVISLYAEPADVQEVAWWAHIGGFAMGLVFTLLLRSPLFVKAGVRDH